MPDEYALRKENFKLLRESDSDGAILKGTVYDGVSRDPLPTARIYFPESSKAIAADAQGRFDAGTIHQNIVIMDIGYVGYEPIRYVVGVSPFGTETEVRASVFPVSKELESVTITAERVDENVTAKVTGVENLSIAAIKTVPAFLGEVDPIRTLTTLPGVTTTGELASGFIVRGGEAGQNLVLQDGATIYNPSHLFGFFSAFNRDLVSNVTLYKGGGPANYGGRISSVLDVSLRNGDSVSIAFPGVSERHRAEPLKAYHP